MLELMEDADQQNLAQLKISKHKIKLLFALGIFLIAVFSEMVGYMLGKSANYNNQLVSIQPAFIPSPTIILFRSSPTPSPRIIIVSPTSPLVTQPSLFPSPTLPEVSIFTADWKTYINSDRLYSFRYPSDWNVSEEKRNDDIRWVVTLRPPTTPCPSNIIPFTCQTAQQISITTIENSANNVSLTDYLSQMFGQFKPTYTPITINGVEGLRTSDIPGQFDQENAFVKNKSNIYQIVWIKGPATKQITKEVLNKFLSSFKFTY